MSAWARLRSWWRCLWLDHPCHCGGNQPDGWAAPCACSRWEGPAWECVQHGYCASLGHPCLHRVYQDNER